MIDKIYIILSSVYAGPIYCIEHKNVDTADLGTIIEKDREAVLLAYENIPENADVPSHILYKSITVDDVTKIRPEIPWAKYIED